MDDGVDTLGQPFDQLAQAHRLDGLVDLGVGGRGPGEGQVVPDGAREEERLLGHHAELAAKRIEGHPLDVVAVDAHLARRRVVEAGDELGQRGLPGSGGAHEGDGLSRRDAQVHVSTTGISGS